METANEPCFQEQRGEIESFHLYKGFRVTFDLVGQQQLTAIGDNCRNVQNFVRNVLLNSWF